MVCSCNSSRYKYDHVDMLLQVILVLLKIVNSISKGPDYRKQNNIDWSVNLMYCKADVSMYAKK